MSVLAWDVLYVPHYESQKQFIYSENSQVRYNNTLKYLVYYVNLAVLSMAMVYQL